MREVKGAAERRDSMFMRVKHGGSMRAGRAHVLKLCRAYTGVAAPPVPAGVADVPEGVGEMRRLEGLQLEGCPLPPTEAALYAANPLLLVQVGGTYVRVCVYALLRHKRKGPTLRMRMRKQGEPRSVTITMGTVYTCMPCVSCVWGVGWGCMCGGGEGVGLLSPFSLCVWEPVKSKPKLTETRNPTSGSARGWEGFPSCSACPPPSSSLWPAPNADPAYLPAPRPCLCVCVCVREYIRVRECVYVCKYVCACVCPRPAGAQHGADVTGPVGAGAGQGAAEAGHAHTPAGGGGGGGGPHPLTHVVTACAACLHVTTCACLERTDMYALALPANCRTRHPLRRPRVAAPPPAPQVPKLDRLLGLTALDLSHNRLTRPPTELLPLTQLATLSLRDNPLVQPYAALLEAQVCVCVCEGGKLHP